MRGPAERRDSQVYCHFHKDHGHTTEECKVLQREIESLIAKGHLKQFVKSSHRQQSGGRNNPRRADEAPPKEPHVINTISGGPSAGGPSSSSRKAYARQVNLDQGPTKRTKASISLEFDDADLDGMGISDDRVKLISSPLYGFIGASAPVKGIASLTVIAGEGPCQAVHTLDFLIVKVRSSYNGILGRMGLNKLQAVTSTYHLIMKFLTPAGAGFVKGDQILARRCYVASCKAEETLSIDDQRDEKALRLAESAVSAVLIREQDGRQFPIYYVSKVLQGAEQRYPNAKKLAFALLIATRKLWPYFQSHTIIVLTDKPLRRILHKPDLSGRLVPWSIELGEFDIHYRPRPSIKGQALADFTEVTNRTLLQGIKKKLDGAKGLWVDELHKILWAYNTTTRAPTGETPFSLSFGTEALIPIEIGLPSLRLTTYDTVRNEEALRANLDLLDEQREQAAMRLAAYQHRVSKFYDQRVRPRIFRVGDLVLRRITASAPRDAIGKLAPNWEGPYKVVKLGGPGAYHLETMDGKEIPRTWNATNLRRYYA
ncbi:hypothetical protein RJ639_023861 [Escallonia herrerae]|uniref:Reverse transcriptase RNase H-like domain-containing protein n=1 Tax=Escallonia herrerae TaxID=1293975 RepID=A0AA88V223_9ASTE|nr:hypothetical protein RJ639_023861 [Escallonia herrerae]